MKSETNDKQLLEDILSDEILSDRLMKGDLPEKGLTKSEIKLSNDFLRAVNINKVNIAPDDKAFLADRITGSIALAKKKRFLAWIGYAASLIIIAGLSFYFITQNQPDIIKYAASISVEKSSESTQLMLPDDQTVRIEEAESKIAYSKNGNTIVINASNEINQPVENKGIAYNTVFVPYGKRSQVVLPDNSSIWLNSGSTLVYPVRFDKDKREVYLEGEALFEITHDKDSPFHVLTKSLEVKVLGTVFDLSAYDEDSVINTILEKGSVEISYNKNLIEKSYTKISPGELASFSVKDQLFVTSEVNTKDFTSWKDGYMALEKKSLESITRRLSRYYNVTIEFEDPELAKETFSGYLDLRSSAVQVLGMIAEMVDIQIIQTGKVIKISRKGTTI